MTETETNKQTNKTLHDMTLRVFCIDMSEFKDLQHNLHSVILELHQKC